MKFKYVVINILIFILVLIVSNAMATVAGKWLKLGYSHIYNGTYFFWGINNTEVLDGWLLSYVFFASLFFPLYSGKWRSGFFWSLPVFIIYIYLGSYDPHLWLSFIFLVAGLGLAWVILKLKAHFSQSQSQK